jgi:hypothetical protein
MPGTRNGNTAGKTLAPIVPDDFPEPLHAEYASILEALTWLPGDESRGIAETTLDAMTEEEAGAKTLHALLRRRRRPPRALNSHISGAESLSRGFRPRS